jgi:RNA polymerase sigma factor for flagellar operon FliA
VTLLRARAYARNPDDELVTRHAALIARCGRRIAARTGGAVSPEDLWSAGAVGLLDAARRFDAAQNVSFEQFAEHRIRGAMLDELRRIDHLPRRLRADVARVDEARSRLSQALGREPGPEELAGELGVELEELEAVEGLALPPLGLDGYETVASEEPRGDELLARGETLRAMTAAIAELPDRLQLLLSLHYVEGLSYREIAHVLKVSEPRVCQLHREATKLLRGRLEDAP